MADGKHDCQWRGVKRDGTAVQGVISIRLADLAAITEDRFKAGWRSLTVTSAGTVVAAIERSGDRPHKRTWWAAR